MFILEKELFDNQQYNPMIDHTFITFKTTNLNISSGQLEKLNQENFNFMEGNDLQKEKQ